MTITLRFALRWFNEPHLILPVLPAYLGESDAYAIQFMEFPFINWILAPFFIFGVQAGRVLNNFGLMILNLGLVYWSFIKWRGQRLGSVKVDGAFLLIPLLSASGAYFSKQVPDFTASVLILLALGFSYDEKNKNFLVSFLLLSLGALIKPPQVVALVPLLLHPNRRYIVRSALTWILPASIPCILYYTIGSTWVLSLGDIIYHFGAHIRNPIESLMQFFGSPKKIYLLIIETLFGRFIVISMAIVFAVNYYKIRRLQISRIFIIFILQIIGLALLDGDYFFDHQYYFSAAAFTTSLLFIEFLQNSPRILQHADFILILINFVERSVYELSPLWSQNIYSECSTLKSRNPHFPWSQGYGFRSIPAEVPELGLCFGEREGSTKNRFGFFKSGHLPNKCKIIDQTKNNILGDCTHITEYREKLEFHD